MLSSCVVGRGYYCASSDAASCSVASIVAALAAAGVSDQREGRYSIRLIHWRRHGIVCLCCFSCCAISALLQSSSGCATPSGVLIKPADRAVDQVQMTFVCDLHISPSVTCLVRCWAVSFCTGLHEAWANHGFRSKEATLELATQCRPISWSPSDLFCDNVLLHRCQAWHRSARQSQHA